MQMSCDAPETEVVFPPHSFFYFLSSSAPLRQSFKHRRMEYKLIMAVSGFPSLYDMNSPTYRDLNMRSDAWRQVAEIVGVPGEFQHSVETPARTSALTREHFRCGRDGKLSKHVKHSDFHQREKFKTNTVRPLLCSDPRRLSTPAQWFLFRTISTDL